MWLRLRGSTPHFQIVDSFFFPFCWSDRVCRDRSSLAELFLERQVSSQQTGSGDGGDGSGVTGKRAGNERGDPGSELHQGPASKRRHHAEEPCRIRTGAV